MAFPVAKFGITTTDRASPQLLAHARGAALELGVPFFEREQEPFASLFSTKAEVLLIFEVNGVSLIDREGTLRFSPGMAHLRIKQLDRGVLEDLLLSISGLGEGDRVLDCTLGLGADAQVAARRVGPNGWVTALEKSARIYALVKHGLARLPRHPRSCAVEVVHADAHEFLRNLSDGAFDYVFFDPMFTKKRKSSHAFEALRRHADYTPLTPETLAEARRVAGKAVLVKGARYSSDFKKLGLQAVNPRPSATVIWARLARGDPAARPGGAR